MTFVVPLALAACGKPDATAGVPAGSRAGASDTAQPKPAPTFVRPPNFGYYEVSRATSTIEWEASRVTGRETGSFAKFTGHVEVLEPIAKPRVELDIETSSIVTENPKLVAHLKSPDFFDVSRYPTAHFRLREATHPPDSETDYQITGDLDLHGVTRAISFPVKVDVGGGHVRVKGDAVINRKDFGIVYPGKPDDLIRDTVTIHLNVDAVKRE